MDGCRVCGEDTVEPGNAIVYCDNCNVAVHQMCYGVHEIPDGEWFCKPCLGSPTPVKCEICGMYGGAFVPCDAGNGWIHAVCALWMPGITFTDPEKMEVAVGLSNIDETRKRLMCGVCKRKGGCIQCADYCGASYHPACALNSGMWMKIVENTDGDGVDMQLLCRKHQPSASRATSKPRKPPKRPVPRKIVGAPPKQQVTDAQPRNNKGEPVRNSARITTRWTGSGTDLAGLHFIQGDTDTDTDTEASWCNSSHSDDDSNHTRKRGDHRSTTNSTKPWAPKDGLANAPHGLDGKVTVQDQPNTIPPSMATSAQQLAPPSKPVRLLPKSPPSGTGNSPHQPNAVDSKLALKMRTITSASKRKARGTGNGVPTPVSHPLCCVCGCGEDHSSAATSLVKCNGCSVRVHADCYGVDPEVGSLNTWLCQSCSWTTSRHGCLPPTLLPQCLVCPVSHGALVAGTGFAYWLHASCAIWLPGISFADPQHMWGVQGIDNVDRSRFQLVCEICGVNRGACVQCSHDDCVSAYHASCAMLSKSHFMHIKEEYDGNVELTSYCAHHSHALVGGHLGKRGRTEDQVASTSSKKNKIDSPPCGVCGHSATPDKSNLMVACSRCEVSVHSDCYGVKSDERGEGWLCKFCKLSESTGAGTQTPKDAECALCGQRGGAFTTVDRTTQATVSSSWVHTVCANWVPGVWFGDVARLESVRGIDAAGAGNDKLVCTVCKRSGSGVIVCVEPSCKQGYHPFCAMTQGFRMRYEEDEDGLVELQSWCGPHSGIIQPLTKWEGRPAGLFADGKDASFVDGKSVSDGKSASLVDDKIVSLVDREAASCVKASPLVGAQVNPQASPQSIAQARPQSIAQASPQSIAQDSPQANPLVGAQDSPLGRCAPPHASPQPGLSDTKPFPQGTIPPTPNDPQATQAQLVSSLDLRRNRCTVDEPDAETLDVVFDASALAPKSPFWHFFMKCFAEFGSTFRGDLRGFAKFATKRWQLKSKSQQDLFAVETTCASPEFSPDGNNPSLFPDYVAVRTMGRFTAGSQSNRSEIKSYHRGGKPPPNGELPEHVSSVLDQIYSDYFGQLTLSDYVCAWDAVTRSVNESMDDAEQPRIKDLGMLLSTQTFSSATTVDQLLLVVAREQENTQALCEKFKRQTKVDVVLHEKLQALQQQDDVLYQAFQEAAKEELEGMEREKKQQEQDWQAPCVVCQGMDSEPGNFIIFCGDCDTGYHQRCAAIEVVPDGEWFCNQCAKG